MYFLLKSDVQGELEKVLDKIKEKMNPFCHKFDVTKSQPPSKVRNYQHSLFRLVFYKGRLSYAFHHATRVNSHFNFFTSQVMKGVVGTEWRRKGVSVVSASLNPVRHTKRIL